MSGWQDAPLVTPAAPSNSWKDAPPAEQPQPNPDQVDKMVQNAPGVAEAKGPLDAFYAGLQMSASGFVTHGRPDLAIPKDAGFFQKLTYALGQGVGDLPFNIVGSKLGQAAGAAAGAAVPGAGETGASEAIGAAAGGGAGAMALPQVVREAYMDYYNKGEVHNFQDFLHMFAKSAWNVGATATVGAVAGPAAKVVGPVVGDLTNSTLARSASELGTFATAATGVQATFDGKMPDAQDFAINSIAALGFHVAGGYVNGKFQLSDAGTRVSSNQENIFRQTGTPPWEQADMAKRDPQFHDELLAQDVNGDPVAPRFNATRPPEAPPYKTNAFKVQGEHDAEVNDIHSAAFTAAHVEHILPLVRGLEASGDDAISPAGAIGRYQIMPGTARQYGFDPAKLTDPAYNEKVARVVLADLSRRFHGDTEAVLIAYNAGPGRAMKFLADGRDTAELPKETQNYLTHAGKLGENMGGEPPEPPEKPPEPPTDEAGEPDFGKLNTDMRLSRFQDAIGDTPTKPAPTVSGFIRQWVSELESARGVDRELVRRGLIDPTKDLTTEDMFRQTYASDDRASHFFMRGAVDPITFADKGGPSLLDIVKKIKAENGSIEEFNMYRVAARTIEKAKQGIDTGVFKGGIQEAQANYFDPSLQKYKAIDAMMQEWKKGGLEYARDSGSISQQQMDRMQAANTSHVSLRRIIGDNAPFVPSGSGRGFRTANPLKVMEGSDRQIVEPMTADMDNLRQIVRMADRNRAIGYVIGSQEFRDAAGLQQITGPEAKATLAEPGSNIFKPYSMTPEEAKAFEPLVALAKKGGMGANRFVYYNKGTPELWEAKDPDFASLLRGADSPGEADIISKMMQFPAKLERAGIVGAPDFAFRIPLRHQLTAFILDPLHPPPYLTALRGMLDSWNMGDKFWDLARNGGLNSSIVEMDRDYVRSDIQKVFEDTGVNDKMWNVVRHPLQFAQMITERLTAAGSIGYNERAKAMGVEPIKAATMARKAYLDYHERPTGQLAQMWAKWVPFFRPALLGMKQFGEAASDNPSKTALYTGLGLVAPQIALYALNRAADQNLPDEQKYTSLPQWERDLYFVSPPIGGQRIRLAKPFMIGPIIGAPLERFLEKAFEDDPHAFDGLLGAVTSDTTPAVIPAAVKPVLEQATNHNFFTGQPLISDSLKAASPDMQYTPNTSQAAIDVARLIGTHQGIGLADVSPAILDNYVQEWTGSTGMAVLKALNVPLNHPSLPSDLSDIPFVKGFVVRNPGMGTQQISDFYSDAEKFEALHQDKVLEVRQGMLEQAMQDAMGSRVALVENVKHALNVQRAAIQSLAKNDKMSTDEKRQLIEKIYADAWAISRFGSKALHGDEIGNDETNALAAKAQDDIAATGYGAQQ